MTKKVKTIWQGKAGLHEKYIKEALEKAEELELLYAGTQAQYKNQRMTIAPEQLRSGEIGKEAYPEKHGEGFYRLIYFKWTPDKNPQGKLL